MRTRISLYRTARVFRETAGTMAGSDPWKKLGISYKNCLKTVSAPGKELHAAFSGKEFAGAVLINMSGTFSGYIQTLCVAPAFRGRKIGEFLMRHAEKRIFRESPNVFLCVSSFNKGAMRFYERLGYRRVGVLKDFLVKGRDEYLMRKTAGPRIGYKKRP